MSIPMTLNPSSSKAKVEIPVPQPTSRAFPYRWLKGATKVLNIAPPQQFYAWKF